MPADAADFFYDHYVRTRVAVAEVVPPGHMSGEIALQPLLVVPVGAGWIAWPPFVPIGIGCRHVGELATEPDSAHREMRIKPDIRRDELTSRFSG
jgi:hypothetical protein